MVVVVVVIIHKLVFCTHTCMHAYTDTHILSLICTHYLSLNAWAHFFVVLPCPYRIPSQDSCVQGSNVSCITHHVLSLALCKGYDNLVTTLKGGNL